MTEKVFRFKAQVWRWPGDIGWHFVSLSKELSKEVQKIGRPYGAGFLKVRVTVKKSTWVTALFPDKRSDSYIMSIKKPIRKKEGIWEDDIVRYFFCIRKMKIIVKAKPNAKTESVERVRDRGAISQDLPRLFPIEMKEKVQKVYSSRREGQPSLGLGDVKSELVEYKVSVKEAPVGGRANEAITKALAKYFDVAPSLVKLISGASSKRKVFEISGW